ncbi:MAG: glycosyltransferase family 2 protein [Acidimicrobiia bacterium]
MTGRSSEPSNGDQDPAPYVVVTPVRNEEKYVEQTIRSMLNQTMPPAEWILVDDGSTDRTPQILRRYALEVPWLRVVTRADRGFRASGRGVVDAFYEGYRHLRSQDWDYIVKLDGDLVFDNDYFEQCLQRFARNPRLGIAGGTIESVGRNGLERESHPMFHVRGATKIYRRRAWEEIGGVASAPGWDGLDEIKASMRQWETRTFSDLILRQLRTTGSAQGQWSDWLKRGEGCYLIGYHPVFLLARSIVRARRSPHLVASAGLLVGYLRALLKRLPRAADVETVAYVREQQIARLLGRETIWR